MTNSQSSLQTLPLAAITESTYNPRKTFDAAKLAELDASIAAQGLLQPILVRPLPGHRVASTGRGITHEVVAGARRYRACKLAGLTDVMAVVCNLSDTAAMEAALIENLQRDDLSELEEAEGYAQLCSMSGISKDDLAAKVHRSTRYIFNRLKLLKLQPLALTALRNGQIDATTALQIASVHDGDLQAKALDYAIRAKPRTRELQTWMRDNVMLALNRATFDITDITLNKPAGACTTCPKRTGADPDLFSDTTGPDSCCNAPCYHAKTEQTRIEALAKYAKQGIKVIDADEYGQEDIDIDDYTAVSQTREDTTSGKPATLLDLLGKKGQAEVGLVAIERPYTKGIKVYVDSDKAEAWLLAQGLVKPTESDAGEPRAGLYANPAAQIKNLKAVKDRRVDEAGVEAAQQAIQTLVLDLPGRLVTLHKFIDADFIRAFLTCHVNPYNTGVIATALGIDPLQSSKTSDLLERFERVIAQAQGSVLIKAFTLVLLDQMHDNTDTDKAIELVADVESGLYASLCQPDADTLSDIQALAQHAAAKDIEAQIAELEAKINPPKTASTQSPAGAAKPNAREPVDKAKPKLKKAKLTAQEAQLGIADAMQGAEEVAASAAQAQPPATDFAVGQRVKALATLRPVVSRFAGLAGVVTGVVDNECTVKLDKGGRGGGVRTFQANELEAA